MRGARHIQREFETVINGNSAQYLQRIEADHICEYPRVVSDNDTSMLETALAEIDKLYQTMQDCSQAVLQEVGCTGEWQTVDGMSTEIRTVIQGLEDMLCRFL